MMLRPLSLLVAGCALISSLNGTPPLIIAHRGASGYLPEHTLESAAYAHALHADYIEQDVVMSRDDVLVVLHDIHIDTTTDVASRFPKRHRADGRFYAVDFDWAELKSLSVRERFNPATDQPVFPARFPATPAAFRLCTMEAQLQLIAGLNRSTSRRVGVYPEIKAPSWHHAEGKDPGTALISLLAKYGYANANDPAFVQCFEADELVRLRESTGTTLRFVQLVGQDNVDLLTATNLPRVARYAQGIGPHIGQVLYHDGTPRPTVNLAHQFGLVVHPYTVRADALPPGLTDMNTLLELLFDGAGVDGVFTDHTDRAVAFLAPSRPD
ncbi:glycerophosphodiester phosphodiesterase [Synoicihabitans lomoniglobus]|uniref:glycerophosphodiester phosphodiesterase n=1 Tax=Synoicihabitans lomoniglobus TaxID=2909285 RepID=A0AAE9ZZI1_9BACT|nr:glycerophosphodiester phosphodiesterase [Opitutaceae bacterium LMO-M01]WED63442.1 glycerophosphodiester phosphodiesterase [Opitutaceae bacterium LMO-M01]